MVDNFKRLGICIFNRATYSRCKYLIEFIEADERFSIDVFLSGALASKDYGETQYIKKCHPNATFHVFDSGTEASIDSLKMCEISAVIMQKFSKAFERTPLDAVIVVADRYETLPAAIAASYLNIPIIHLQGGEVTGNIDEKVRSAVTKLSDYHFVSTDMAKKYVIRMGEDRSRVWNTGCPSIDVVSKNKIKKWTPKDKYIISIFHPETGNPEENLKETRALIDSSMEFCAKHNVKCYWFWPNPDPGRERIIQLLDDAQSAFWQYMIKYENERPEVFLKRLAGARFVVGNSSVGLREASFIGVPTINIGQRQNLRERSWNVMDVNADKDEIINAMYAQFFQDGRRYPKSRLYGSGRASEYILNVLRNTHFTLKGPLTYPVMSEFKAQHLGEARFDKHKSSRQKPLKNRKREQGSHLSQHGGARASSTGIC